MTRPSRMPFSWRAALLAAAIGCAATAASAGSTEKPAAAAPAPSTLAGPSAGGEVFGDPPFDEAKRDAALADLGRRLAAEPVAQGDGPLNRSGHNYGTARAPMQVPTDPATRR